MLTTWQSANVRELLAESRLADSGDIFIASQLSTNGILRQAQ